MISSEQDSLLPQQLAKTVKVRCLLGVFAGPGAAHHVLCGCRHHCPFTAVSGRVFQNWFHFQWDHHF